MYEFILLYFPNSILLVSEIITTIMVCKCVQSCSDHVLIKKDAKEMLIVCEIDMVDWLLLSYFNVHESC